MIGTYYIVKGHLSYKVREGKSKEGRSDNVCTLNWKISLSNIFFIAPQDHINLTSLSLSSNLYVHTFIYFQGFLFLDVGVTLCTYIRSL